MAARRRKKRVPPAAKAATPGKKTSHLTYVLLGLSAVIVGLTIYVGMRMNEAPVQDSTTEAQDRRTEEQIVLDQAQSLIDAGAARKAAELLGAYARLHPRSIQVGLKRVEALWYSGQEDAAEKLVDQIRRIGRPAAKALWYKGELVRLRERRRYAQSLTAALWVPGVPMPGRGASRHMHYFRLAAEKGADTGGKIWMMYALELLNASEEELRGEGDLLARREELAAEYLDKALAAGVEDVRALWNLGKLAMRKSDFKRAATMLSEAARKKPDDDHLWLMLAQAQKEVGELEQADRSIRRALDIRRSHQALMLQGQIAQNRSRYDQAAEAYVEAAADPDLRPAAYFQAARCYYDQDKYALAMKYVDRAMVLTPGDPTVAELQKSIEVARFGRPETEDSKLKLRLRPTGEEQEAADPATTGDGEGKARPGALPGPGTFRP